MTEYAILLNFALRGQPTSCERYGNGHINDTYRVVCSGGDTYILQRLNGHVFKNPKQVMHNISLVTRYLKTMEPDPRRVLNLVPTVQGEDYHVDEEGEFWRVYDFVVDSICLERAERPEDFYESGVAFGQFQNQLVGFDASTLYETIPDFHNTPARYRQFKKAVADDRMGYAAGVREDIEFILAREEEMSVPAGLLAQKELPLRVTHNDTKLNNVMLDAKTRKALCVIDLDTVMPGLSIFDYGDSIRFGASTAAEDERDLSLVQMDLGLFRIYTEGFYSACGGSLAPKEVELLPLGAKVMTLECGLRFLADYLQGDVYFKVARPGHNLDRWRTQRKLVSDMEAKWGEMQKIVRQVAERNQ